MLEGRGAGELWEGGLKMVFLGGGWGVESGRDFVGVVSGRRRRWRRRCRAPGEGGRAQPAGAAQRQRRHRRHRGNVFCLFASGTSAWTDFHSIFTISPIFSTPQRTINAWQTLDYSFQRLRNVRNWKSQYRLID